MLLNRLIKRMKRKRTNLIMMNSSQFESTTEPIREPIRELNQHLLTTRRHYKVLLRVMTSVRTGEQQLFGDFRGAMGEIMRLPGRNSYILSGRMVTS
jgi:hypothetical protein